MSGYGTPANQVKKPSRRAATGLDGGPDRISDISQRCRIRGDHGFGTGTAAPGTSSLAHG
ncbi:hypothetical protein MPLDJ20_260003 [Mesorhizobium plurifarium]|uniref:Uncharacterized protein n=1 Tax=Mesorhizobium plurifarium TaxID=69974 RepID=A0A090F6E1_MESPL|nr:hypothetical protein MPLDJ20_260003 [Mesorhizobium plurifarium]